MSSDTTAPASDAEARQRKADENRATLEAVYAAFFRGDLEGWLSFFDESSVFWEADSLPYGGVARGREGARATVMKMVDSWDDVAFDVEEMVASEQRVIAYGTFTGTGKATGKRVSFPLAEMWMFRNGKVAELKAIYGDTALAAAALGHDPAPKLP